MFPHRLLRIFILFIFGLPISLAAQTSDSLWLCSTSSYMISSAPSGVVYDPGGPFGDYNNYEYCRLLIDPGCVGPITLDLTEFQSEGGYDYLRVYDGADESGVLLGAWAGFATPVTFTASTGRVFITWSTDGSVVLPGFRITWSSELTPPVAPEAGFIVSDLTPAFNEPVFFTDTTIHSPRYWEWSFGDSTFSVDPNPAHLYVSTGTYTVQLIVTNCHGLKDTVKQIISVQAPPVVQISPAALQISAPCGTPGKKDFTVSNTGAGDLLFSAYFDGPFGYSITPPDGKVAVDTFSTVTLNINTDGFLPGNYEGIVHISTNDTTSLFLQIPVALEITGQPILTPSPEILDFGLIRQFETANQYVVVQNTGCSPLEITAVTSGGTTFSVVNAPFIVDPFSYQYLLVTCTPQDTGLITGNLIFESNAGIVNYPLQVTAAGSPILTITPAALDVNVSCNDSATVALVFANTGLGDLSINNNQSPVNVLVMSATSYNWQIGYNITNWISEINPGVNFIYLDNYLPQEALDNVFAQADMVIVPAFGGFGTYSAEQIRTVLEKFTAKGGSVLVSGTPYTGYLQESGLFQTGQDAQNFSGQVFNPTNPFHPLVENIDFQNDISYSSILGLNIQDPGFESVISFNGYEIVGYRPSGAGKVIYVANECYYTYNQDRLLIQNAFRWAARPKWMTYELPDTILSGETATASFTFRSEGLWAGDYQTQVNFTTNDPVHPYLSVPVTMHVIGNAAIALFTPALHFGVIQQFTQKTFEVTVGNNGCDTLFFNDFVFTNPDFSTGNLPPYILPGTDQNLQVVFQPLGSGNYQDTLTILSDGGTVTVQLSAVVLGAPVVDVNPETISVALNCDETQSAAVTITNSGIAGYNYSTNYNGDTKVAVLNYGAAYYRVENLKARLTVLIPDLQMTVITGPDANAFADSLAKVDILVIPSIEYDDFATFTAFKAPITNFINNGGVVLISGVYLSSPLEQMGLVNGLTVFEYAYNGLFTNRLPAHPIVLNTSIPAPEYVYVNGATFPASAGFKTVLQARMDNQTTRDFLSYKSIGDGFLVWLGVPFESAPTPYTDQIMNNVFEWAYQPFAPGVTLTAGPAGNVPASTTQTIEVEFAGNNIPGGTYPGQIRLYGNDPANNPVTIPVTITVGFTPCVAFEAKKESCDGRVNFTDQTLNSLTSWYWAFGDGSEDFSSNPSHNYVQTGDYTVTLVGCNNSGCDTMQQTIVVNNIGGPLDAVCKPVSVSPCCGAGIQQLQLGTIDHTSGTAEQEGYQDFSCQVSTELTAGEQYAITITTGNQNNESVVVWIDFNNNGIFSENEKGYNHIGFQTHEGFITVPANAVKNVPLRLRVASDINDTPQACGNIFSGQAEDYSVVIKGIVGAQEPAQTLTATVYPNPTAKQSWLTFVSTATQTAELTITNQTGQIVKTQKMEISAGEQKIELPHQEAGIYTVHLQTGDQSFVTKWICFEL